MRGCASNLGVDVTHARDGAVPRERLDAFGAAPAELGAQLRIAEHARHG